MVWLQALALMVQFASIPCFISSLTNTSASCRSTNLDSWTPEQLKMMAFGGNNRAQIFFKQHGWTDGGKIEAKYTSRAAELYRQMLSKEVAKSLAEDNSLPSSPVAVSLVPDIGSGLPELKLAEETKASTNEQHETEIACSPRGPVRSTFISSIKKPIGAKKIGSKSGGLGARKLTTKVNYFPNPASYMLTYYIPNRFDIGCFWVICL